MTKVVFTVHTDDPKEVIRLLRHTADVMEDQGRVFTGEIFNSFNALMGRDTTLVEISKEE